MASLAQWLERSAVNRKVAGSIPAGGVLLQKDDLSFFHSSSPFSQAVVSVEGSPCGVMDNALDF